MITESNIDNLFDAIMLLSFIAGVGLLIWNAGHKSKKTKESDAKCNALNARFGGDWYYEGADVYKDYMTDRTYIWETEDD